MRSKKNTPKSELLKPSGSWPSAGSHAVVIKSNRIHHFFSKRELNAYLLTFPSELNGKDISVPKIRLSKNGASSSKEEE